MMRMLVRLALAAVIMSFGASAAVPVCAQTHAHIGPQSGALVVVGGGSIPADVMNRFIALAGGADARIVILPGAGTEDTFPGTWSGYRVFRAAGVQNVAVLHTRNRAVADSERFVQPLRSATGVWIPGGRQWRLTETFLGTRTERELHALLARGGVIGGTSAGASVQASYMVRGAVEGNHIMMAPGNERGFGFLRDAAVDQHLTARNRQNDMLAVVERHPQLLGIGLDEGTAIVVRGDRAEVMGRGRVAFYNARDAGAQPYYFLDSGAEFDLQRRETLRGQRVPPATVRTRQEVIEAMNRLFTAMRQRDTATIRTLLHPDLRIYVPLDQNGTPVLRVSTTPQFITSIAAAQERFDERAYEPEVRVDGPLAAIWTYYEFWLGEAFSHCGTDALHFVRTATGWQISALAYTIQREGCRRVPRS